MAKEFTGTFTGTLTLTETVPPDTETPPEPQPEPPEGLQAIPVAMFSPANLDSQSTPDDPWRERGSWDYWGMTLQKTGPVICMPLACGINPNYSGDAYSWAAPDSIMVNEPNDAWMISMGLNMPEGPSLTDAATGAMDGEWGNAIGSARFGAQFGHGTGENPWDLAGMFQARSHIYLRPGWEETGSWYTWSMGAWGQVPTWATDFAAAFRRCVDVCRNYCATPDMNGDTCQVTVCFNPNGDYSIPAYINLDDHYPGDAHVDACCIDVYDMPMWQGGEGRKGNSRPLLKRSLSDQGGRNARGTPNLSPQERWDQFILPNLQAIDAFAHAHGKAVGVCEWAAGGGAGDNPVFVEGMAAWAASAQSPVAVLGYWSGGPDSGYDGDITKYPLQMDALIRNYGA